MTYNGTDPDGAIGYEAHVEHSGPDTTARFYNDVTGSSDQDVVIAVWLSDDGALVVQADVDQDQRVRVNVNDGCVFDQHTGTGEDFGSREPDVDTNLEKAVRAAKTAAYGDSNDDEISSLQEALSIALRLLNRKDLDELDVEDLS